jgi:DNA recombination protein RmuC
VKQELVWGLLALVVIMLSGLGWLLRALAALRAEHARRLASLEQLQAQLGAAQADAARLPDARDRGAQAEAALEASNRALREAAANEARLNAELAGAGRQVARLEAEKAELADALAQARAAGNLHATERARAEAAWQAAEASHVQTKAFLEDAQARLRTAFAEVAGKLFDEKALVLDQRIKESGELGKAGMENTLKPFAEQLGQFATRIEQMRTDQTREQAALVGTIGELKTLNQTMAASTDGLAKALKGNAKTRGDWGEMILDTVLKASGLEEGVNYARQGSSRDEDSGKLLRPDVIVNLPDGRQLVVDSKVNLVAWSEANNADSHEAQQDALIRHTAALRAHVKDLSDKNYPKAVGAGALDLTVLFVPIEGALAAALSVNSDLQAEAFAKRVVFASPNTLMAMLSVVNRLWSRDRLQRQVGIIGEEAGKVLDALSSFLGEFDEIDTRLRQVQTAYGNARRRLAESDQSVVARARRLVEAGARGKRALNSQLEASIDPALVPLAQLGADEAG